MLIKLKYLTLAFAMLGLFVTWKVFNLVLPVIIGCIVLYIVYYVGKLIKGEKV
mgnify:CR=1 FL=1